MCLFIGFAITEKFVETVDLDGTFSVEIEPHGSRLYTISEKKKVLLIDANMRINRFDGEMMEFDYPGDAELLMSKAPGKIFAGEKELPFESKKLPCGTRITFTVPEKGVITLK